jgi:hypothetical protein
MKDTGSTGLHVGVPEMDKRLDGRFGEGFRMPASRDLSARAEGRRPKASQERTRGALGGGCRLWGFDAAAPWLGDALAGVVGDGARIAVASLSLRRRPTEQCCRDRRVARAFGAGGASDATPEARGRGSREVW